MISERTKNTVISVLDDVSAAISRADAVRCAYYKELAHACYADMNDPTALFRCGPRYDDDAPASSPDTGAICRPGISGALFSRYYTEICDAKCGLPSFDAMFPAQPEGTFTSVSYVTGGAADDAFEAFRRKLPAEDRMSLRPQHAERVQNACDTVLDGSADFAIVPVWNNADGRLRSFYRMIDECELKILAVSSVAVGDTVTRFALCGDEPRPLSDPDFIEFSVTGDGNIVSSVIEAMNALGHDTVEVNSYPSARAKNIFHFIFRLSGDFRSAILYLNLFHQGYSLLGLYFNADD